MGKSENCEEEEKLVKESVEGKLFEPKKKSKELKDKALLKEFSVSKKSDPSTIVPIITMIDTIVTVL